MIGRLNHVGVATPSIEASVAMYRDLLGATKAHAPFDLPAQGVRVCFVDLPNSQIELIEPLGDQRFLEPYSGLYWQISGQGHEDFPSRSLWDRSLRTEPDRNFVQPQPPPVDVFALYPSSRYLTPKVRAFVDYLHAWFKRYT